MFDVVVVMMHVLNLMKLLREVYQHVFHRRFVCLSIIHNYERYLLIIEFVDASGKATTLSLASLVAGYSV